MIKNKDIVPRGWEGKKLTLATRIGYFAAGAMSIFSIIGSIPIDSIGMPINYALGIRNESFTKKNFYLTADYIELAIKGKFPPYDK